MVFDRLDFSKLEPGDSFKLGTCRYRVVSVSRGHVTFDVDGRHRRLSACARRWDQFCRDTAGLVAVHPWGGDAGALVKCVILEGPVELH